jgi:hypothetical protein
VSQDITDAIHAPARGVVALTGMSAFDYLTLRRDVTARRLIPGPIREFVKIAERTGCDLHRVTDLVEVLIAARFVPAYQ